MKNAISAIKLYSGLFQFHYVKHLPDGLDEVFTTHLDTFGKKYNELDLKWEAIKQLQDEGQLTQFSAFIDNYDLFFNPETERITDKELVTNPLISNSNGRLKPPFYHQNRN